MSLILVTPLSAVPETVRLYQPSHLITLLSAEFMIETPEGIAPGRHLRVSVNDIADPQDGKTHPSRDHIAAVFDFVRDWDGGRPLLIHCWAGVSRSMATAYAVMCARLGPGAEKAIASAIRARAPHASPNRLLVRLADDFLSREGKMVQAVDEMGRAVFVEEGTVVEFPLSELAP